MWMRSKQSHEEAGTKSKGWRRGKTSHRAQRGISLNVAFNAKSWTVCGHYSELSLSVGPHLLRQLVSQSVCQSVRQSVSQWCCSQNMLHEVPPRSLCSHVLTMCAVWWHNSLNVSALFGRFNFPYLPVSASHRHSRIERNRKGRDSEYR